MDKRIGKRSEDEKTREESSKDDVTVGRKRNKVMKSITKRVEK